MLRLFTVVSAIIVLIYVNYSVACVSIWKVQCQYSAKCQTHCTRAPSSSNHFDFEFIFSNVHRAATSYASTALTIAAVTHKSYQSIEIFRQFYHRHVRWQRKAASHPKVSPKQRSNIPCRKMVTWCWPAIRICAMHCTRKATIPENVWQCSASQPSVPCPKGANASKAIRKWMSPNSKTIWILSMAKWKLMLTLNTIR